MVISEHGKVSHFQLSLDVKDVFRAASVADSIPRALCGSRRGPSDCNKEVLSRVYETGIKGWIGDIGDVKTDSGSL
jgi:hypothetical protein